MISGSFSVASAIHGLAGGMLIGIAAAIMLLWLGRIAGVSGIAARAAGLSDTGPPASTAWAFLIGLPLGAALLALAGFVRQSQFPPLGLLVVAGLIVGLGTRLGSGCTSGHGVCGMSRLSPRSLVATLVFIAACVATVAAMRSLGVAQ